MASQPSLERAVQNVLTQSLALRTDQNLLIFADRDALAVADAIAQGALANGVQATTIYVPRAIQDHFSNHEALPHTVEAAVREADAIVSCLSDRPEHFAYRARVLRDGWRRRTKMAHVPGINAEILALADTDFDRIGERALLLALAFVLGQRLELSSTRADGSLCRLEVELRGWEFPPGISDGVIPEGSWGNLPPGEAFVVPFRGQGQVVINGSLPGYVLGEKEELILTFDRGRLQSFEPEASRASRHLIDTQLAHAQNIGDRNWDNLAEIGIGLNPAVGALRGVELIDEKKAGTAHIALGNSALLGGTVESSIHCDLVIDAPTITIDDKPILERGEWTLREEDWLLNHRRVDVPNGWWDAVDRLRSSGSRAEAESDSLFRLWSSRSGRRTRLAVGNRETARLAAQVYSVLPERSGNISRADLMDAVTSQGIASTEIPGLLWILHRFDLIRTQNGGVGT